MLVHISCLINLFHLNWWYFTWLWLWETFFHPNKNHPNSRHLSRRVFLTVIEKIGLYQTLTYLLYQHLVISERNIMDDIVLLLWGLWEYIYIYIVRNTGIHLLLMYCKWGFKLWMFTARPDLCVIREFDMLDILVLPLGKKVNSDSWEDQSFGFVSEWD